MSQKQMLVAFALITVYQVCVYGEDMVFKKAPPSFEERPPFQDKAKMARYIVNQMDWAIMTTFCVHKPGYPWGEVVSITDVLRNVSTGIPIVYVSSMAVGVQDLQSNPKTSFAFSEAQGDGCRTRKWDPEDPRCTRVNLLGTMMKLTADEIPAAKEAMFLRHPAMATWPDSHHFFFMKLQLEHVEMLDFFGPISEVSVDEYLKVKL